MLKSDDFAADLPWEIATAGMIKAADLMVVILQATQQLDHAPKSTRRELKR